MISIKCPACSKTLKAPPDMAGKRARCPHCKQAVAIPRPKAAEPAKATPQDHDPFGLGPMPPDLGSASLDPPPLAPLDAINPLVPQDNWSSTSVSTAGQAAQRKASYIAPAVRPTAGWRFWLFSLTLLPLAFSLLLPENSRQERRSAAEDSPAIEQAAETEDGADLPDEPEMTDGGSIETAEEPDILDEERFRQISNMDLDDLVRLFPDNRLPGAHLARDSWMHWFYALLSGGLFFGLIIGLFQQGQATRGHLLGVALLTATCGVMSLIMFQWFAVIGTVMRMGGVFGVVGLLVRLIGFSYAAAMDPENGFLISLVGFTFGVGLCEEFIKALPILARFRNEYELDWRGACVWGLASGVGFGVAEGIIYSSDYYNGIAGVDMYVVRFVSCVALHAVWSASVGVLLWHHQDAVRGEMEWGDWGMALLKVQGVVMLLHGLYDTLLKREMTAPALLTAVASFGFLVWLIRWTVKGEHQPARKVRT